MNPEPRQRDDYSERQIEAARRVLVDVGQVLASFRLISGKLCVENLDIQLPPGMAKETETA